MEGGHGAGVWVVGDAAREGAWEVVAEFSEGDAKPVDDLGL